jgi:hypothetical protein
MLCTGCSSAGSSWFSPIGQSLAQRLSHCFKQCIKLMWTAHPTARAAHRLRFWLCQFPTTNPFAVHLLAHRQIRQLCCLYVVKRHLWAAGVQHGTLHYCQPDSLYCCRDFFQHCPNQTSTHAQHSCRDKADVVHHWQGSGSACCSSLGYVTPRASACSTRKSLQHVTTKPTHGPTPRQPHHIDAVAN